MRISHLLSFSALFGAVVALPASTRVKRQDSTPWGSIGSLFTSSLCSLDNVVQPTAPTPLPSPQGKLVKVTIGRGTQNYTCAESSKKAVPTAIGAVATLYDVSCVASYASSLLQYLPKIFLQMPLVTQNADTFLASPFAESIIAGYHFFSNDTSPRFNLDTSTDSLGRLLAVKNTVSDAPDGSPKGRFGHGDGSVQWLYLTPDTAAPEDWQGFSEVYRLNTAGGNPPETCEGMPKEFDVQYAAEYWFYQPS